MGKRVAAGSTMFAFIAVSAVVASPTAAVGAAWAAAIVVVVAVWHSGEAHRPGAEDTTRGSKTERSRESVPALQRPMAPPMSGGKVRTT